MQSAKEQTRYLMWTQRKIVSGSPYHESWEEQAFADDSSGLLGGCVWPPRSYSCSFCRREFRSAQALGGHMNVHRRDRARLKQSLSPTRDNSEQYPSQINPNPNPNPTEISRTFTDPLPVKVLNVPDLKLGIENWKLSEVGNSTILGKRNRADNDDDDAIVIGNSKRSSVVKPVEVLKFGSNFVEEIDLELRLGDPPKVK